jgi:hypothetical protein
MRHGLRKEAILSGIMTSHESSLFIVLLVKLNILKLVKDLMIESISRNADLKAPP